jgi:hypothetical protein
VVDGVTGAPIPTPAVVALEKMGGDFQLVQQVAVAADGSFKFDNVASGPNYALVFNAQDNAGGFYTPLVLAGGGPFNGQLITPGTNVGTIKLAHNGPPTAGSIHTQEAASTASNTPATITIKIDLRTFVEDFEFSLPMIGGMPTTTTQTSSCSDPSTACSQVTLDVPTDPAQFEEFGTNQPPTTPTPEEDYLIRAFAFVPGTNEPDCSPSEQDGFLPGMNRGDNLSVVIPTFKGCK